MNSAMNLFINRTIECCSRLWRIKWIVLQERTIGGDINVLKMESGNIKKRRTVLDTLHANCLPACLSFVPRMSTVRGSGHINVHLASRLLRYLSSWSGGLKMLRIGAVILLWTITLDNVCYILSICLICSGTCHTSDELKITILCSWAIPIDQEKTESI